MPTNAVALGHNQPYLPLVILKQFWYLFYDNDLICWGCYSVDFKLFTVRCQMLFNICTITYFSETNLVLLSIFYQL